MADMDRTDNSRKSQPRFHLRAVQDHEATERAGHPVFVDREYIEVRHPGAMNTIPCVRVKQRHIDFWPEHYAAFKRGEEVPIDGFPIEEWAAITRGFAETMKALNIRTVEQLAEMPETSAQGLGAAIQRMRLKAKLFIKNHNSEQAQIDTLKTENKTLQERLEKLEALIPSAKEEPDENPEEEKKESRNSSSGRRKAKAKAG